MRTMSHLLAPAKPASEAHTQPVTPHTAPAEVSPLANPHAAPEAKRKPYIQRTWYCPRCGCHRAKAPPSKYRQGPSRLVSLTLELDGTWTEKREPKIVQVCVHCHRVLKTGGHWDKSRGFETS